MSTIRISRYTMIFLAIAFAAACAQDPSQTNNLNNANNRDDVGADTDQDQDAEVIELVDPVTIMTWNVERYFDTQCDSFCGDGDFEEVLSPALFEFRATQIADAIRDSDPDILLLQELEKEVCLEEIATNLGLGDTAFGETFFGGSLDVGVATRGTITEVVLHRDDTVLEKDGGGTEKFAREFLEVHIELDGREIIVFNAHFKAKRNDDPAWREAEARGAHEIVTAVAEENPDALIVMGGDLNDTPGSDPLDALTEELELVSSDETGTYFFGELQAIDHLLFSPETAGRVVKDSVQVVTDRTGAGAGLATSDHSALMATFGFLP